MIGNPQAKKRARQAIVSRSRNMSHASEMRTYIKNVLKAVLEKNHKSAMELFRAATSKIHSLAGKGIIHRNKAARLVSRLNTKVKAIK
ncbi:MAG: 30S ribosomal protein S20 [Thiotrichales bacterium]|nr:MAG: 30S ribosomal protein S20 [Thiotrichales bacterium]